MQLRNRLDRPGFRRSLRRQLTHAEAILWRELQGRRLESHRFRRRFSVGPYILDFYCPSACLAIELDGNAHDRESAQRHDESRDAFMTRHGIRILRFRNDDVRHRLDEVLTAIAAELSPPVAKR